MWPLIYCRYWVEVAKGGRYVQSKYTKIGVMIIFAVVFIWFVMGLARVLTGFAGQ